MAVCLSGRRHCFERKLIDQLGRRDRRVEERKLILILREALFLLEKGKISLKGIDEKKVSEEGLLKFACKKEKNFIQNFWSTGTCAKRAIAWKTGLNSALTWGFIRAEKSRRRHTQWVIKVAEQSEKFSMPEYSRMVRLARTCTRTVDCNCDSETTSFYEARRILPRCLRPYCFLPLPCTFQLPSDSASTCCSMLPQNPACIIACLWNNLFDLACTTKLRHKKTPNNWLLLLLQRKRY